MTDGDILLRAICADPADDFPRLAYADWLEEHGQSAQEKARAEFIRLQISLAQLCDDPNPIGMVAREQRLLDDFGYYWVNDPQVWPVSMTVGPVDCIHFSRGFVKCWDYLRWEDWAAHHEAILSRHPLQEVSLTTFSKVISDVGYSYPKRCWLAGFHRTYDWFLGDTTDAEVIECLLPQLWPQIQFTLPRYVHE